MLRSLRLDLRFAFRSLLRRPVFATIAVVTLALGIDIRIRPSPSRAS